jgi:hypothetical protein
MAGQASDLILSLYGILMDSPHWKKSRYASFTRDNRKTEEETMQRGEVTTRELLTWRADPCLSCGFGHGSWLCTITI